MITANDRLQSVLDHLIKDVRAGRTTFEHFIPGDGHWDLAPEATTMKAVWGSWSVYMTPLGPPPDGICLTVYSLSEGVAHLRLFSTMVPLALSQRLTFLWTEAYFRALPSGLNAVLADLPAREA